MKNITFALIVLILVLIISGSVAISITKINENKDISTSGDFSSPNHLDNNNKPSNDVSEDKDAGEIKTDVNDSLSDEPLDSSSEENSSQNQDDVMDEKSISREDLMINPLRVRQIITDKDFFEEKVVFLTFDDGPSTTITNGILDVLKDYKIKATFFILGNMLDRGIESHTVLRRIDKEGHSIGNHLYSHLNSRLYPDNISDIETIVDELRLTDRLIGEILDRDYYSTFMRFPGGEMSRRHHQDSNLEAVLQLLESYGVYSIDWNASGADSSSLDITAEEIYDAVVRYTGSKRNVVLLLHDSYSKAETLRALPWIIEFYIREGYSFRIIGD